MKIIVDTREQKPLSFKHKYITEVINKKLDVGDYGCRFEDGHNPPIFFERKSISDLYGTLSSGYKRFKKEILRSQKNNTQLIVIVEGSLSEVLKGHEYSKRRPQSVVAQIFTLLVRHSIWTVFCQNRRESTQYITQFYIACGKEYIRRKKDS